MGSGGGVGGWEGDDYHRAYAEPLQVDEQVADGGFGHSPVQGLNKKMPLLFSYNYQI